jgi:hypothetical protein
MVLFQHHYALLIHYLLLLIAVKLHVFAAVQPMMLLMLFLLGVNMLQIFLLLLAMVKQAFQSSLCFCVLCDEMWELRFIKEDRELVYNFMKKQCFQSFVLNFITSPTYGTVPYMNCSHKVFNTTIPMNLWLEMPDYFSLKIFNGKDSSRFAAHDFE